ncbi:MAG: ATP-binding protein, partial [Gemmatimonadaceae bacterium]
LRRAAWLSAVALVAIALTVAALALFDVSVRAHLIGALIICVEIVVVLFGMSRLTRQIMRHATALEEQRLMLGAQAAELAVAAADALGARSRAEAETRQKARVVALLDAALASSPVGFGFFDRDLRYLRVNETLARINGRAPEDHIGAALSDFDPELAERVGGMLRRVLETREPLANVESRSRTPGSGGEVHNWLTSFYPIVTEDGELFGVGVVVTDVSELKRLEEQLFQAQKMEAVGRLAGGVAHDFNNLLTVINSYAELMLDDPALSNGYQEAEEIRAAALRAARLTRQLLAFSRRQTMEARVVNPNDVLRGVETLLRQLVVGNVEIITDLSPNTPFVNADPGQLEQVVMNLAINAADAMPQGGQLHIATASTTLGEPSSAHDPDLVAGEYATIRVTDTGHGMDEATAAQIFEPFFTTKEAGRGTGLGLSTVYGIVKQFGGSVEVVSEPGAGTVFTVYLPASAAEPATV